MLKIGSPACAWKTFQRDKSNAIIDDFAKTVLYEQKLLADLEAGREKITTYRQQYVEDQGFVAVFVHEDN
jgi:hypothetical protein